MPAINVTSTATIPPYFAFGLQDIGRITVPKRVGPTISRERKLIDQFSLQYESLNNIVTPPYDVRSFATGGYWDNFIKAKGGLGPSEFTAWPAGWQDYIDPALVASGWSVNVANLDTYINTIAAKGVDEEEVWFMPNVEANGGEFMSYIIDPYNPSQQMINQSEWMQQAYRLLAAKWRVKRPEGFFAYYVQNAMLAHWYTPAPYGPFSDTNKLVRDRNSRASVSRSGWRIRADEGLYDACDGIFGIAYFQSTQTDDQMKAWIADQMEQCHLARKANQIVGCYFQFNFMDQPDQYLTDQQITLAASELRKNGAERMIIFGYESAAPERPRKYRAYWDPKFDLIYRAFI